MKELSDFIAALQRLNRAMDDETRVMTCSEAAFVLGKTPQTVSRYINEGKLHRVFDNGISGVYAREVFNLL